MKRITEDNTVSVLQKAIRHFHIPVTNTTIKESLKTHPQYPTFKSICDFLEDLKIEHYPLRYTPEEADEIKPPYIAHFKDGGGKLAFVTEVRDNKVHYFESYSERKIIEYQEFQRRISGVFIVMNPDSKSGEKDFKNKKQNEIIGKAIWPLLICGVILFLTILVLTNFEQGPFYLNKTLGFLFLTKTMGLILSALLLAHEYEAHISFADKLCHLNKFTNCNTVLNDNSAKAFGWFGWADIGFLYFTGGLLVLVQNLLSPDFSLLAIFAALALPYTVFSVYYQGFVLKKWCPFCLGVQLVLVTEFVILLPQISIIQFSFIGILKFTLTFLLVAIIYITTVLYYREKRSNESNFLKYLGLKKNPFVLKTLLLNQLHYDIPVTEASLVFGEKESPLKITVFLSLKCPHCARAFEKIKGILNDKTEAQINIIIVTADSKVLNTLYFLNRSDKNDEALNFLDKWFNSDPYSREKISETLCIPDVNDISKEVRNENLKLYRACNVIGTPTFFVNGYLLPRQYDIDDIDYFSESMPIKAAIVV